MASLKWKMRKTGLSLKHLTFALHARREATAKAHGYLGNPPPASPRMESVPGYENAHSDFQRAARRKQSSSGETPRRDSEKLKFFTQKADREVDRIFESSRWYLEAAQRVLNGTSTNGEDAETAKMAKGMWLVANVGASTFDKIALRNGTSLSPGLEDVGIFTRKGMNVLVVSEFDTVTGQVMTEIGAAHPTARFNVYRSVDAYQKAERAGLDGAHNYNLAVVSGFCGEGRELVQYFAEHYPTLRMVGLNDRVMNSGDFRGPPERIASVSVAPTHDSKATGVDFGQLAVVEDAARQWPPRKAPQP